MELTIFNRNNTSAIRKGERSIRVSITGGIITFSKTAIREMKLKKGDKVIFGQQKGNTKNWFVNLSASTDQAAFELVPNDGVLIFRCTQLARNILASFKESKSILFFISNDSQKIADSSFFQLIPIVKSQSK